MYASESIDNAAVVLDLAPGLWIWRLSYPDWHEGAGWPEVVTSTCVESGGEVAVLDPLAPPEGSEVWERLDAKPPTMAVVLKPDHVRDVDLFVSRYGARAFGPWLFERQNIPQTELEPIEPGLGAARRPARALRRPRAERDAALAARAAHARVRGRADGADGELRIWDTPHIDRARPALRELLELPFERVIVAHGEPVHDRAAFERALELPTWLE